MFRVLWHCVCHKLRFNKSCMNHNIAKARQEARGVVNHLHSVREDWNQNLRQNRAKIDLLMDFVARSACDFPNSLRSVFPE